MLLKGKQKLVITISLIVGLSLIIYLANIDNTSGSKTAQIKNKASFVNLGAAAKKPKESQFATLNAEELIKKADSIILNADEFVKASKIMPPPELTAEQKEKIDQEIAALEQKIKQIERNLKP